MRIFALTIFVFALAFVIPKDKLTIKFQTINWLLVLSIFLLVGLSEVFIFGADFLESLSFNNDRLESMLSVISVYALTLFNIIILIRSLI